MIRNHTQTSLPKRTLILLVTACAIHSTAHAQNSQAKLPNLQQTVISWPKGKISLQDVETDLLQAPAHERDFMRSNPSAVFQIAENILIYRSLNALAAEEKFLMRPEVATAREIAASRATGRLYLEHVIARDTPSDEKLELAAKEQYTINPKKHLQQEEVSLSHLLVSTAKRSKEEALSRIKMLEDRIKNQGANLNSLVDEFSDDRESARRMGSLGTTPRGKTVPKFEAAAFALKTPGEYSPIVETEFGFHIIRLDGKQIERQRSFDEVKTEMVREARAKIENDIRARVISDIRNQPGISVDDTVFTAYTGAERLKATANPAPQGPTLTPSRPNRSPQ